MVHYKNAIGKLLFPLIYVYFQSYLCLPLYAVLLHFFHLKCFQSGIYIYRPVGPGVKSMHIAVDVTLENVYTFHNK